MNFETRKELIVGLVTNVFELKSLLKAIFTIKIMPNYIPYLKSHERDVIKNSIEKVFSEPKLEDTKNANKLVLLIPSYYFGSLTLIVDLLFILHFKKQGANVVIASPTRLFESQDPLFGGSYNRFRRIRIFLHLLIEQRVAKISKCEFVELGENLPAIQADAKLAELQIGELRAYEFQGYPIGEHAWKATVNLRDGIYSINDERFRIEMLAHIYNQMRYWRAFESFLEVNDTFSVFSNSSFYYRWTIPHSIMKLRDVRTYCYILAEKMNSLFVTSKHDPILSLDSENIEQLLKNVRITYQIQFEESRNSYYSLRSGSSYSNIAVSALSDEEGSSTLEVLKHSSWKRRILVPCNVAFDAAVLQGSSAFSSYEEFLEYCLELSTKFSDCLFIFKIHPAERIFKRDIVSSLGIIQKFMRNATNNVLIIDSNNRILASDLINHIDVVVAYSSSMALEASTFGKIVITCGQAHYQSLSFLSEVESKGELFSKLKESIKTDATYNSKIAEISTLYSLYHFGIAQIDFGLFTNPNPDLEAEIVASVGPSELLNNEALKELTLKMLNLEPIHSLENCLKPSGIAISIFSKLK